MSSASWLMSASGGLVFLDLRLGGFPVDVCSLLTELAVDAGTGWPLRRRLVEFGTVPSMLVHKKRSAAIYAQLPLAD